jgi:hypothetical protein
MVELSSIRYISCQTLKKCDGKCYDMGLISYSEAGIFNQQMGSMRDYKYN